MVGVGEFQIREHARSLVTQVDHLPVAIVLDDAAVGQHREMSVDETRTDALVVAAGVLTFEESDLVCHVAHRGRTGLDGEILNAGPTATVG